MEGQDNNEDLITKLFNKNTGFTSSNDRHSYEYERVKEGEFAFESGEGGDPLQIKLILPC